MIEIALLLSVVGGEGTGREMTTAILAQILRNEPSIPGSVEGAFPDDESGSRTRETGRIQEGWFSIAIGIRAASSHGPIQGKRKANESGDLKSGERPESES
jgi:hypothetical protein